MTVPSPHHPTGRETERGQKFAKTGQKLFDRAGPPSYRSSVLSRGRLSFQESDIPKTSSKPAKPAWIALAARYQVAHTWKGVSQICSSFIPFFLLWYLMYRSLDISYLLTLVLALPTAGFMIRVFIIQHDCGHGSFFKSRKANDIIGSICGILTLTPYHYWRKSHAIHHATVSDLDRRGTGDIWTMTIREYLGLSRWGRLKYRLYRHPLILFVLGPPVMLALFQRFPSGNFALWNKERASILWTNLILLALAVIAALTIGLKEFLMVQVPIVLVTANAGTWLFFVQHQFEGTYWSKGKDWDYYQAAMKGSSYYKLPRIFQWFTGNIGFHHIHHLSPRIPNYHLQRCHDENPPFQEAVVLTIRESLRTALLALWDEERGKLVSLRFLESMQRPEVSNS